MQRNSIPVLVGIAVALLIGESIAQLVSAELPPASSWPTGEMELKSRQLAEAGGEADVVIIGTSASGAAIDPDLLANLTKLGVIYNAAIAVSTPVTNAVWLEDVVLQHASPDLVIVGIAPTPVQGVGEAFIRATENAATTEHGRLSGVALIRHRGVLADWDSQMARKHLMASGLWTESGHINLYYDRIASSLAPDWVPVRSEADYRSIELALEKMVRAVQLTGADIVFVVEPFCCAGAVEDPMVIEYLEWLKTVAEASRVELWDLYSIGWSPDLYADPSHFNKPGTEGYTRRLAELIRERFVEVAAAR